MRRLFPVAILILLCGCGIVSPAIRKESKLSGIEIGLDRASVVRILGNPDDVRGSRQLENGSVLRVDEYYLYSGGQAAYDAVFGIMTATIVWWFPPRRMANVYWIQYVDGKIDHWARAGDWQPQWSGDITVRNK